MVEPLRIQQIRQFVIAATSGSFRAAATGTFRSQAAVSAAMRDLERQIGAKLFEQGRRARLTPLAQMLLPIFNELLTLHDRALTDARQLAQAERGSISLAVVPVLAEEWLPVFLTELVREHPNLRIRATDQRSPQVRALVADGTVDIGVCGQLADDPKLSFQPIAIDAFGILCPPSHRLARNRRGVAWSALRDERLIGNDSFELLKGSGLGEWIEDPAMVVTSRVSSHGLRQGGTGNHAGPHAHEGREEARARVRSADAAPHHAHGRHRHERGANAASERRTSASADGPVADGIRPRARRHARRSGCRHAATPPTEGELTPVARRFASMAQAT